MGPDLDLKGNLTSAMDISPIKDGLKMPEKMACANNCEDDSFLMEALPNRHSSEHCEDAEINVIDNVNSKGKEQFETESPDATEYSSSFGDTDSGDAGGAMSNDLEVESELRDDGSPSLAFDMFGDLFQKRKKKLTPRWRRFIHPLAWRCKWAELKIRELQAQSLKYGRELAECDERKQLDFANITTEDLAVKSTPISFQNQKINVKKRKKRKRLEQTTDVAPFMLQHNLLSFLVKKKSRTDWPFMEDDYSNTFKPGKSNMITEENGVDCSWPCLEFKDDSTLEGLLHKIDEAKFQLQAAKVRMDKLVSENADRICSNIGITTPCEASQQNSQIQEDVPMHDSAVSSHGEAVALTDTIRSADQPEIGPSCPKVEDEEVLIYNNQSIKLEDGVEPFGKPQLASAVQQRSAAHSGPESEPVSESKKAATPAQPSVRTRSVSKLGTPKNKRKRARRKARLKYSRRSSG